MSVLPSSVIARILLHQSEVFKGLALGYELLTVNTADLLAKERADGMREAFEIAAATLEETAKRESE